MGDPVTIGLAVAGTALSAYQQHNAGIAAQQQANAQAQLVTMQNQANMQIAQNQQMLLNNQAQQLDVNAGQERAAAQRKAIDERRRARLAESKAIAINAAGGGNTLDPSVMDILGDLESEGTYNANTATYEGEERARDLETQGNYRRYEGSVTVANAKAGSQIGAYSSDVYRAAGKNEAAAGNLKAASTILNGGSSLLDKYG